LPILSPSCNPQYEVHYYPAQRGGNSPSYAVQALLDAFKMPVCLGRSSDSSDSISYIDKYSPENITTTLKAIFNIGNITYSIGEETLTMDVAPEIKDDRTFVPVRFLAYALSVPEEGVQWNGETQTVTITKDETAIELKIGSTVETVNGEPIKMDVAPYIKETGTGGRTMLPARWIAEPLGATVTWDETTQQVKIEMVQEQG